MSGQGLDPGAVCGAPTCFHILAEPEGGFTLQLIHRCVTVPPCLQVTSWGPFEDLETAAEVRRIAWANAIPIDTDAPLPLIQWVYPAM